MRSPAVVRSAGAAATADQGPRRGVCDKPQSDSDVLQATSLDAHVHATRKVHAQCHARVKAEPLLAISPSSMLRDSSLHQLQGIRRVGLLR
jgi:hypothetical protein